MDTPTCLGRELAQAAMALADQCWSMDRPVRALTVTAIYLIPAEEAAAQLELWAEPQQQKRARRERLELAGEALCRTLGLTLPPERALVRRLTADIAPRLEAALPAGDLTGVFPG